MVKDIPVVIVAFGTTTSAFETYRFMDYIFRERFKDNKIIWAYSSRIIRDSMKVKKGMELKGPAQILNELRLEGYEWAVVQSLHILWGHEFFRMVQEIQSANIRTSVGFPLLTEPYDYQEVAELFANEFYLQERQAYVLIGHGTDHPAWTSYIALQHFLRKRIGQNIYVGVLEGTPSEEKIFKKIFKSEIKKVTLVPFMLVTGTHFYKDILEKEASWRRLLMERGISISVDRRGLGERKEIVKIFIRHIKEAMNMIPHL